MFSIKTTEKTQITHKTIFITKLNQKNLTDTTGQKWSQVKNAKDWPKMWDANKLTKILLKCSVLW